MSIKLQSFALVFIRTVRLNKERLLVSHLFKPVFTEHFRLAVKQKARLNSILDKILVSSSCKSLPIALIWTLSSIAYLCQVSRLLLK